MSSIIETIVPSKEQFQVFINLSKLSKQQRSNLSYLGLIHCNGRDYHSYKKITCTTTYWALEKIRYALPAYYFPNCPHIISSDPHALWHEFNRLEEYFNQHILKPEGTVPKIGALTIHDGAYPRGGFANQTEYDRYVQLYINSRHHEIPAYNAGLAGAPAFNARDPFPHGYCYLLMIPNQFHAQHFREGQDFLTKEILERIWPQIDRNRIICYELRAADAHISLEKRPGANSILIKCGDLADKLRDAFLDGVADHEELTDIYYSNPHVNRS